MNNQNSHSLIRHLTVMAALTMLGLGALAPASQAAEGITQPGTEYHLMIAATDGMDRRQERREDRRDDRGDRHDVRQDCRDEEGVAGKDKRDCKQEGREERRDGNKD